MIGLFEIGIFGIPAPSFSHLGTMKNSQELVLQKLNKCISNYNYGIILL